MSLETVTPTLHRDLPVYEGSVTGLTTSKKQQKKMSQGKHALASTAIRIQTHHRRTASLAKTHMAYHR